MIVNKKTGLIRRLRRCFFRQQQKWIQKLAGPLHTPVEMRACSTPGRADLANNITLLDPLTGCHVNL